MRPPVPYARPSETRLRGWNRAVRIGGHRVHLGVYRGRPSIAVHGVGFLDLPERPLKVDCDIHKVGADFRVTMKIVTELATLALSHGAPPGRVAAVLRNGTGGPAGIVEDCDGVESANSVSDLIGQVLLLEEVGS